MTDLRDLGLNDQMKALFVQEGADFDKIARVIREYKELYVIRNRDGEFNAEITGNMRFAAESRADFPAVGDWVEASIFDGGQAIIHKILPRFSVLERQTVNAHGEKQLIATNIHTAFIVQAVDRDFNINRLERYFMIAHSGEIRPVVILNKSDLISEEALSDLKDQISVRMKGVLIFCGNAVSGNGLNELENFLQKGETYCFVGSSGVGKSTIINALSGEDKLETKEISQSSDRGKHTTTHRELVVLPNGSILIDTPGMREIGVTDSASGLEMTFSDIAELAKGCKFKDCSHTDEPGCSVLEAVEAGTLSPEELDNYKKLERQQEHFSASIADKRKKDKQFGKMIKGVLQAKKKSKY